MKSPLPRCVVILSFLLSLSTFIHALFIPPEIDYEEIGNHTFAKRVCEVDPNSPDPTKPVFICDKVVEPTYQYLLGKVQEAGVVGTVDSLFWSRLAPPDTVVNPILERTKQWHCQHVQQATNPPGRGCVLFTGIVDNQWYEAEVEEVHQLPDLSVYDFQKRLSRAYARLSTGTAYLFTLQSNDGRNMDPNTAWASCEYPTLTNTGQIDQIIQVDPTIDDDPGHPIWTKNLDAPVPLVSCGGEPPGL
ncbi:hypothetical protein VTN77DRAFT_8777 [Rasamsonia byssochlamydoides]|uniref:uncharacterized protein n=1 Tax=Rasamsonia byssochlamydoides TaxID=89139 RepID=UPI0037447ECA